MSGPHVLPMLMEHEVRSTQNHDLQTRQSSIARSANRTAEGLRRVYARLQNLIKSVMSMLGLRCAITSIAPMQAIS